jgi:hypothetical protein
VPYTFPEAHHDLLAGTSFSQEEFDDRWLFAFDVHCHFSLLAVKKRSPKSVLCGYRFWKAGSERSDT